MRTLIINMLAAALLLFGASSASAFSINHTTNYDGFSELEVSDTVTVHVFIDSEGAGLETDGVQPGINLLSVGVIFGSPSLAYDDAGTLFGTYAYLNYYYPPYNYPPYITADNGSQSAYLLFTFPATATGTFPGQAGFRKLVPQQTPWETWPAPPEGYGQVALNWNPPGAVPDLAQQVRSTTNTWLGSIVLHVTELGEDSVPVQIFVNGSCCAVRTGDGAEHKATTTLDAPTTINLPEPTIALLLGFGLLGLGLAGRRQD